MELREIVAGEVETVAVTSKVTEAVKKMHDASVGALAAIDGDDVVGIFTERDLVRVIATTSNLQHESVGTWMTPFPDMLEADSNVDDAANWMLAAGYRHIPVIDNGALIGMASIKDVLWALTEDRGD